MIHYAYAYTTLSRVLVERTVPKCEVLGEREGEGCRGLTVWLVYARVFCTMAHASSQERLLRSIRMRISSGTAMVGWVSFIWKHAFSGSSSHWPGCFASKRDSASYTPVLPSAL